MDVMAMIEMGITGHFYPVEKLDAIYRFERLLTDMTPVLPWLERAYHSFAGDDMADNLSTLADKINDPSVRKATRRLAKIMRDLKNFMGPLPTCFDAFQNVDMVLSVMDKTAEASPESFARLAYIREWFATTGEDYLEARGRLSRMLELEKSGEWQAPDSETLSHYLPEVVREVEVGDENDIPY